MLSSPETLRFTIPLRRIGLHREPLEAAARQEELEAVRKNAYEQGFEDATAFLNQQLAEQRSEVIQLQEETFKSIVDQHAEQLGKLCALLPELAIEIARRVLSGTEPDRGRIELTVAEVLAEMPPGTRDIEIALAPADLALLGRFDQQFQEKYPSLRFVPDDHLQAGDCRMRSCFGLVDARLETKFGNLARSLQ